MQGGFVPDIILYLSYFYTNTERKCFSCLRTHSMTSYSANSTCMVLDVKLHGRNCRRIPGRGHLSTTRTQQRSRMEVSFSHRGSFNLFVWPTILHIDASRPDTNSSMVSSKRLVHRTVSGLFSAYVLFGQPLHREEIIIVNRVLRDDPSKSDMHNRQGLTLKMIWQALCDWRLWPLYILGLTHMSK